MSNARNLANLLGTNTLIQPSNLNLAANYAFTGTVTGAGAMELISSDATGASNVAYTDVTLSQSTDYHHQILVLNGYYHNDSTLRDMAWFTIEGGSFVNATNSYYDHRIGRKYGVSTDGSGSMGTTQMRFNWYSIGNSTGEMVDVYMKIFNAPSSSLRTTFHAEVNGFSGDGNIMTNFANSIRSSAAVCEGIRMGAGAGNMSYSSYALYGVKK